MPGHKFVIPDVVAAPGLHKYVSGPDPPEAAVEIVPSHNVQFASVTVPFAVINVGSEIVMMIVVSQESESLIVHVYVPAH